jgi:hypothetical protein
MRIVMVMQPDLLDQLAFCQGRIHI